MLKEFMSEKFIGYVHPKIFEKYPEILIVTNKTMIDLFHQYGQFCTFDITYKLIRQEDPGNHYRLGCFVGQSQNCSILPFALVVVNK